MEADDGSTCSDANSEYMRRGANYTTQEDISIAMRAYGPDTSSSSKSVMMDVPLSVG